MAQILSNQWIAQAPAPLGPARRSAGPIRRERPRPALPRRIAGDGPALPPGGRRPLRAAPGPDRPHLRRAMSISCWLALTISSIPAARPICSPCSAFCATNIRAIFQRQIGYVLASLLVSLACGLLGAALTSARPEFMRHFCRPGDDRHHGAPRDVDRIRGQRRAHGLQRHHDQQPLGQLCHLRRRHHSSAWARSFRSSTTA